MKLSFFCKLKIMPKKHCKHIKWTFNSGQFGKCLGSVVVELNPSLSVSFL